ncbi:terpenoid cyclases/protein prenyltransferase alpha-alpha toroid [Blastocladiella britannica]|nr:terpenoid cyclases/protein prenyltransferase alpha-alpha toroid [Blastocladiella britannica]
MFPHVHVTDEMSAVPIKIAPLRVFLARHLQMLPNAYTAYIGQRITFIQFILGTLDLIGALDAMVPAGDVRTALIDFIYTLQHASGGFVPSTSLTEPDLASTYSALACLVILGDPLDRVNRLALTAWLTNLEDPNSGGFRQCASQRCLAISNTSVTGQQKQRALADPRFTYCAVAACHLLRLPWDSAQKERTIKYLLGCQTYEGGFAVSGSMEAHGGYTYCATAALALLDALPRLGTANTQMAVQWALRRQEAGYSGRTGKPNDTCYSFWIGAAIHILGAGEYPDATKNEQFLQGMQSKFGGFGKNIDAHPDLLHTYMAVAALALTEKWAPGTEREVGRDGTIAAVEPMLNLSRRALYAWQKQQQ